MTTRSTADDILSLQMSAPDRYLGRSYDENHLGTIFGGRIVAQALASGLHTVDDLPVSSMHAYFLAPTSIAVPIEYRVDRLRDSRRFANRLVTAYQNDQRVFILLCEFHADEAGFEHQSVRMPDVPFPEDVPTLQEFVQANADRMPEAALKNFLGPLPVEMRVIDPEEYFFNRPERPERKFWFRLPSAATIADERLQNCLLAYESDYWLAGVSVSTHMFPTNGKNLLISSLDHSMWFHRPVRCEDWLLYHTFSPAAQGGLGLAQGSIYDRTGKLVASTSQECLLRRLTGPPKA